MEYGLIGERLGHSFSAEIHPKIFGYEYELLELPPEKVGEYLQKREFSGINVTIPYKQTVLPYLDEIDPGAREIGAVNTVVNRDGKLRGYNTDLDGMKALICRGSTDLSGARVLILGSGGTSRTAAAAAKSLGAAEIFRVSRSGKPGCITYEEAVRECRDTDYIINTTPCGMFPQIGEMPLDPAGFSGLKGVFDTVYNPLRTALVQRARDLGIPAEGGLYMLVVQAIAAAELFAGTKAPDGTADEIFGEMYQQKRNLVMIGMPGSGKTTIGKKAAKAMGMDFVDTDIEIEKEIGGKIAGFIAEHGETAFRDQESEVIRRVAALQHTVIATGGGSVLRRENVSLLKENGTVCFLDRPLRYLVTSESRPLSSNTEMVRRRYEERYGIYRSAADFRVAAGKSRKINAINVEREFRRTE